MPEAAVFKPGIIAGNAHTPKWLAIFTRFIPDSNRWGNIHQDEVAKTFVVHLEDVGTLQKESVVSYGNKDKTLTYKSPLIRT